MGSRLTGLTRNGARGWFIIAGVVAVWDVAAVVAGGESLSTACRRALADPRGRPLVTGAIAYLVAHFYLGAGLRRFDPLCVVARGVEAGCGRVRARARGVARGVPAEVHGPVHSGLGHRSLPLHPANPAGTVGP